MTMSKKSSLRALVVAVPVLLAGCGGGSDYYATPTPLSCSVADQKTWVGGYMDDWYFWYKISPRPSAGVYNTVADYFNALLYTGTDANFPADRWSYTQSTADFTRFYGDGQTLGYGISVTGVEAAGDPTRPLYLRYVEPGSAATGRVFRGDRVLSINGVSAADIVAGDDYGVLSPSAAGQQITLVVRDTTGADFSVTLTAAVYNLTPVPTSTVVTSALGRKLGYVVVKDMISQAAAPLETAFAQFRAAGINEVVLDLRYNGGGLVSTGATVASYVAGQRGIGSGGNGRTYASLLYNDKRATDYNQSFRFVAPSSAAGVARVFVLTGPRTCSASEQVINGLRGIGVEVVAIGDTTCGKPVGFLPQDDTCGTTYSAVNFESVNERNEGRYFDGFAPTCAVAEDFTRALGSASEPLLAAASDYADFGSCPLGPTAKALSLRPKGARRTTEPGERQGMLGR
jgi:carboxyl-terminal processing protease